MNSAVARKDIQIPEMVHFADYLAKYHIGWESSNGICKGISNLPLSEKDDYRNTYRKATQEEYESYGGDNSEIIFKIEDLKTGAVEYYRVGQAGGYDFSSKDDKKYEDPVWAHINLITIYRQLMFSYKKTGRERIFQHPLAVATGLPTEHSADEENKQKIIRNFDKLEDGSYRYKVNGRTLRIDNIVVVPQGDGAFISEFISNNLQKNNDYVLEVNPKAEGVEPVVLYIDIGFCTTDLKLALNHQISAVIKDEMREGIETIWSNLLPVIKRKAKENKGKADLVKTMELDNILRETGIIESDSFRVDVTEERDELLREFTKKLFDKVHKAPFNDLDIHRIRFCGGGAEVLRPYIEEELNTRFAELPFEKAKYKIIEEPTYANVKGFLKYARMKFK